MPSPPPEDAAGPPPAPAPPVIARRPQTFASLDLPLDPLASKDQLLRSFQSGRRDPFGNVIKPFGVSLPKTAEGEAGTVVAGGAGPGGASAAVKDPACDSNTIRAAITVKGLIHGSGSSEAIVVNNATGETGSLRPGDRGGSSFTLLPRGCQVQSIDVNAGQVFIAPVKKGPSFPLAL